MRKYRRSGVLSAVGGGWRLYDAAHVVITLAENPDAPLSAVAARRVGPGLIIDSTIAVVEIAVAKTAGKRVARRGVSPSTGAALPGIDREQARVLAAGPKDCYCRVDLKPVTGGSTGGDCPNGHRGSVRCV